jgi:hypothetical protein
MQRNKLRGVRLRAAICLILQDADEPMTVAGIVAALADMRFVLAPGRPGKLVSDAIRWEVQRGRLSQMGRGQYRFRALPKSTAYDMRRRVAAYIADPNMRPRRSTDE